MTTCRLCERSEAIQAVAPWWLTNDMDRRAPIAMTNTRFMAHMQFRPPETGNSQ